MGESTCTVDECTKRRVARGWCKTHYNLWNRAAVVRRTCQAGDCERAHYGRGWCAMHYDRWKKTGGVRRPTGPTGTLTPAPDRGCAVDGCDHRHHSRGYCAMHGTRQRKHGNPTTIGRSGFAHPTGELNPRWAGGHIGYNGMHNRLRRLRGAPPLCDHCGTTTAEKYQWALNWDRVTEVRYGPVQKVGGVEILPYSVDPADYIRLCLTCHRRFDLQHAARR